MAPTGGGFTDWGLRIVHFSILLRPRNRKIKVLKRQVYGYRTFDNFRLQILTVAA